MAPSDPNVVIRLVQPTGDRGTTEPTMAGLAEGLDAVRSDVRFGVQVALEARDAAIGARSEAAAGRVDMRAQGEQLADIMAALIRIEARQADTAKGAAKGAAVGVGGVGGVVVTGAAVDALLSRLPAGIAPWVVLALLIVIAAYVAARRFRR